MVLAALRLADCLLTAESSLLDPHPFLPMQLRRLTAPTCWSIQRPGLFPDWPDWAALPTGPGYPATYRFKALSLANIRMNACSLPLLLPAFWLLDYLLAAETGFRRLCYSFFFATGRPGLYCYNYMRI